jgi:hypothetical protein
MPGVFAHQFNQLGAGFAAVAQANEIEGFLVGAGRFGNNLLLLPFVEQFSEALADLRPLGVDGESIFQSDDVIGRVVYQFAEPEPGHFMLRLGLNQFQQHVAGGFPLTRASSGDGVVEERRVSHELHECHEFDSEMIIPSMANFSRPERFEEEDCSWREETRMFFLFLFLWVKMGFPNSEWCGASWQLVLRKQEKM